MTLMTTFDHQYVKIFDPPPRGRVLAPRFLLKIKKKKFGGNNYFFYLCPHQASYKNKLASGKN